MKHTDKRQLDLFDSHPEIILTKEVMIDRVQELYLQGTSDTQIIGAFINALDPEVTNDILNTISDHPGAG